MYKKIKEGEIEIYVPSEEKVSKKLPVFYNPVMELNRTITIEVLRNISNKKLRIALPLAGSGVRGIRILKELPEEKITEIVFNDLNPEAVKLIKKNLKLNKITKKYTVLNKDANLFLVESTGFDVIDIDPYGSPNFLLNNSLARLGRGGILAVTATDTGCLSGSFPKACIRKYWAKPLRNENMHENGLRILIRKIQLIGAEHEKALTPIYSYSKDHYFKVFFKCEKGKQKADKIMKKQGMKGEAGPMWTGKLWDSKLAKKITFNKFVQTIASESKINIVGFYNLPRFCKKNKLKIKKQEEIIKKIKKKGYLVSETHFAKNSLRSNIPEKEMKKIIKN